MMGLLRALGFSRAAAWLPWAAPVGFGLLSLCLGADANWDLFNYHLYDAYAFLHGKLGTDLAPAGFQSYFNPLLDLPYYSMALHWPARLTGFVMGLLHGLNFVLLYGIARRSLTDLPEQDRSRVPLWLAFAGCLSANFLSELGNSMGDDMTALFVLGALLILQAAWERLGGSGWRALAVPLAAGGLLGLGAGLKLTNAIYAVGGCAAFLMLPLAWRLRLRGALLFGSGVALGMALSAGFWFALMWHSFGNPLFPQFSNLFPSSLVQGIGVADTSWLPKGLLQVLLWPFLFALDARRVGQISLHQAIWPIVYVLGLWWLVRRLRRARREEPGADLDARGRYLLAFVAGAYLAWLALFGVYRYLVAAELLLPLLVFLLYRSLFAYGVARRAAAWTLTGCAALVLLGGVSTWGHDAWAEPMLRADVPALAAPGRDTILITGGDPPYAWLAVFFPPETAFVGLGGNFPAAPVYYARAHEIVERRGGAVYAVVAAHADARAESVARADADAARWGLESGDRGCALLGWAVAHLHLHASLAGPAQTGRRCSLAPLPEDRVDLVVQDRASAEETARMLARHGFMLQTDTCTVRTAWLGQGAHAYQWCAVKSLPLQGAKRGAAKD